MQKFTFFLTILTFFFSPYLQGSEKPLKSEQLEKDLSNFVINTHIKQNRFFSAIGCGDLPEMKKYLQERPTLITTHHTTFTRNGTELTFSPLHWAILRNQPTAASLLIEKKANVNEQWGIQTALLIAIDYGNLPMVKLLVDAGADTTKKIGFVSPLQMAILLSRRRPEGYNHKENHVADHAHDYIGIARYLLEFEEQNNRVSQDTMRKRYGV